MHGESKLRRWVAPVAAATVIAGAALVGGGVTALAWSPGSLTLTPVCAPGPNDYAWQIAATETESNYNIDYSFDGSTWTQDTPLTNTTQPYVLDTGQSSGSQLWVRWDSDTTIVVGPVTADADVCASTPTPTSATATSTPAGGVLAASTPGTGAGPTSGVILLGLILLLAGSVVVVTQFVVGRLARKGKIQNV